MDCLPSNVAMFLFLVFWIETKWMQHDFKGIKESFVWSAKFGVVELMTVKQNLFGESLAQGRR